jgi:hypothetical protein
MYLSLFVIVPAETEIKLSKKIPVTQNATGQVMGNYPTITLAGLITLSTII